MKTAQTSRNILLVAAWIFVLSISDLPDILFGYLGFETASLPLLKLVTLSFCLILCWMLKPIRPLWQFAFVFLVLFLANRAVDWIIASEFWQNRFYGETVSYTASFLSFQILDVLRTLLVIAALWLVKRSRLGFYLVKGQWSAPIQPVRWLGIKPGESWRIFGWIFTVFAAIGVVIPLALNVPLTGDAFSRALPLLPAAILLAGMNAFTEEVSYRASMLSTLVHVVGKNQALLLACVFFGLAHWLNGSPPGLIGFVLTGFLAFLLGKSMLETKGMLWAWIIHFIPDVFIFFSYALTWS